MRPRQRVGKRYSHRFVSLWLAFNWRRIAVKRTRCKAGGVDATLSDAGDTLTRGFRHAGFGHDEGGGGGSRSEVVNRALHARFNSPQDSVTLGPLVIS